MLRPWVTITGMAVGEFDLIAKYFSRPVRHAVLGGGDDCALLAPTPGMQWAVSTDALVEGAMATLFEGRTAIVIAHRVATVLKADRVVVLKDGAIAETGAPSDLLRHPGPFSRWAAQSPTDEAA